MRSQWRTIPSLAAFATITLIVSLPPRPAAAQWQIGPAVYPPPPTPPPYVSNPPLATSGYNPFRYNFGTGRFNYVPIPYEPQQPGPTYNPSRFNWHAGRFDYVPWGPPYNLDDWARSFRGGSSDPWDFGGTASNFIDTRLYARPDLVPAPPAGPVPGAIDLTGQPVTADAITASSPRLPDPPPPPVTAQAVRAQALRRRPATAPATSTPTESKPTTAPSSAPAAPGAVSSALPEGWTRVRGLVGRWEYDYANARWVFVLNGD